MVRRRESRQTDEPDAPRDWIASGFARVEDVVYIGLAILLAAAAVVLLVQGSVAP
ncbi:MAG: hypothetical protein ACREJG_07130 [Candidatus Rokuibacteriota bacterium]